MEIHDFDKDFMNTSLRISIVGKRLTYARSAVENAFALVESIENALSMYRVSSDVYGINNAEIGEEIKVLDHTMDCLEIASKLYIDTLGAIDVCMGEFFMNAKGQSSIKNPQRLSLKIDNENFVVKKMSQGYLDFGAIGKGYAVDKIIELLKDTWEIDNALIDFGSSTIFALGNNEKGEAWSVSFNGQNTGFTLGDSYALASSGLNEQAGHILDPITGACPKESTSCFYALVKNSASLADALSTAFLILEKEEIDELSKKFSAKFFSI